MIKTCNFSPSFFAPSTYGEKLETLQVMFKFFMDNWLILPKQSGFKPGDSCMDQLLSIAQTFYKFLNSGMGIRSLFLDISKAFDKI